MKHSNLSISFFLLYSTLVLFGSFLSPFYLHQFGRNGWIYLVVGMLFSLVIIIFGNNKYLGNPIIKIFNGGYLIISAIIIMYFVLDVLANYLFSYSKALVLLPLMVAVIFFDIEGEDSILNVSTIFLVVGAFLLIIPLFLDLKSSDASLLLPLKIEPNKLWYSLLCLMIPLDYLQIFYIKNNITKKHLSLLVIITFLIAAMYLIKVICLYGDVFLSRMEFPSYMIFENRGSGKIFGQIDFLYLYLLPISVIFNVAFRLNVGKRLLKISSKKSITLTIDLIIFMIILLVNDKWFIYGPLFLLPMLLGRIYGLFRKNKRNV